MHNRRLLDRFAFIPLILWAVIILYPLVWTISGSFKDNQALYNNAWGLPTDWHPENYVRAWSEANIGGYFFNSFLVTAVSLILGVLGSVLAAYIIDRHWRWWTKTIFSVLTASMMLPVVLSLVPKFLIINGLGLFDTRLGLTLIYTAAGIPFGIFTMRSYFATLPRDFEESAYIDGAGHFTIFFQIIVPLITSGISVIAVFLFLRSWNEVYHAMILLADKEKFTVPIGMIRLIEVQQYSVEFGPILAGVVIAISPILVFFVATQRYLTAGLTSGGLKG